MGAYARILVIHPGAPGDLALAAPVVGALKTRFPKAKVDSYSRFPLWKLFDNVADNWFDLETSGIHKLFTIPDSSVTGPADLAVTWMGAGNESFISNLARSTGARVVAANTSPPPGIHATDYLASQLGELIENPPKTELVFKPSTKAAERVRSFLANEGIPSDESYLAVHPGSGARAKCWPPENFARLIGELRTSGKRAVLVEGPADEAAVREVLSRADAVPLLKRPDWELLAALLHGCEAYAGNDSGVTHLAAAVGAPVVAVFGPTDPAVWAPRGKEVTIIKGETSCAPCSAEERNRCRNRKCLESVSVDRVREALTEKFRMEAKNA